MRAVWRSTVTASTFAATAFLTVGCANGADTGPVDRRVRTASGDATEAIAAIKNVCAWPNLTVLGDGAIVATIFNQPSHGTVAGDVECWASEDGGRTWALRGTPAPHEPQTNRMNVAAGLANNGDLLVLASGWSNRYPEGEQGIPFRWGVLRAWICRSSDGGRTWHIDKTNFPEETPLGGPCIPFGDILPGADGKLRAAIYTSVHVEGSGDQSRSYVYSSPDDGRAWEKPVLISENDNRNETAILHLGEGRWLAAARLNGLGLYRSTDDAKSWESLGPVTSAGKHPGHLMRLTDGRILLTCGNRTDDRGVDVRASSDEGTTWSEPVRVVPFQGDGGYPASVQRPDGQVVTAYYARQSPAHDGYHMGVVIWDPGTSLPK